MTFYEFLSQEKEAGRLHIWLQVGAPSQLPKWMDIYAYHLAHPKLSHHQLTLDLGISKSTIQRALSFMNQRIT